jgi:hypothetical protein
VAPTEPVAWLRALFPHREASVRAAASCDFWRWAWAIELGSAPEPSLASGRAVVRSRRRRSSRPRPRPARQAALCAVRARHAGPRRRLGLERGTSVRGAHRGALLPTHSRPLLGKHGNARGWRRNRIRTAGGFTLDAIGLDVAARGVKLEDQRPDFIIFDDIDGKLDTPATTAKKIATLTTSLLPAGSANVAVLGIQNLIIPDGIFSQLVDGRADFLPSAMSRAIPGRRQPRARADRGRKRHAQGDDHRGDRDVGRAGSARRASD